MNAPYDREAALRESTQLADAQVVGDFCRMLDSYVRFGTGGPALIATSNAAAGETKRQGLAPERLLCALRLSSCRSPRSVPTASLGAAADERYARAVRQFLTQYFST